MKFVKGFNQPIVVFLTPIDKPGAIASFDVQYFVPTWDAWLCGHGTVAALKVILDSATNSPGFGDGSQFPMFSSPETHTVEFTNAKGVVFSARKVVIPHEVTYWQGRGLVRGLPSGGETESYPLRRRRESSAYSTAR